MALRSTLNMNMNMNMNMHPMMQPTPPPHAMLQPRIIRMGPPMMGQVPIQQRPVQMPNGQYMMQQQNPAGMMAVPQSQQQPQQQQHQPQPQPQSQPQHQQQFQQQPQPQQQQQFSQMPTESSEFMPSQNQYSPEHQQQQFQQAQQQSSQYSSPQMVSQSNNNNNGNMPLSNKLLVAGMTTMVGTQLFDGGEFGSGSQFDNGNGGFKGLSFLPLQQLFPVLFSSNGAGAPYASSAFMMFKMTLFFGGLFLLGQPYLLSWLGSLDDSDPKKNTVTAVANGKTKMKVKDEDSVDSWQLISEFVHLIGVKTGLVQQELNEKLTGISEFNKRFQKLVLNRVQNFNSTNNTINSNNHNNIASTDNTNEDSIWKQFIRLFIVMFTIDERLIDTLKSDDVIQFQFNRLILTKLVYMKLGPMLGGVLLLQRLIDSLMLSIVKTVNTLHLDGSSSSSSTKKSKKSKKTAGAGGHSKLSAQSYQILKLIKNDLPFIESASLFDQLYTVLQLDDQDDDVVVDSDSNMMMNCSKQQSYSCVKEFSETATESDTNVVNLVCTIRASQLLNQYMVEYLAMLSNSNLSDAVFKFDSDVSDREDEMSAASSVLSGRFSPGSGSSSSSSFGSSSASGCISKTQLTELLSKVSSDQISIPANCVKLIKCQTIFKSLLNPVDVSCINETLELILGNIKNAIEFSDAMNANIKMMKTRPFTKKTSLMKKMRKINLNYQMNHHL
ncbi:unnamed protein product [Ambrosiozyma monospora]|uniref:Unnamed protein product n=1 Tax=Ambrosiozyma monospora TaxID=43982 RepID=A0A9W7DIJ6_AMBMO|nr:unnamed protein product [Ambrosiozyma monospora]